MSDEAQYRFGPFEVRPLSRELRKNGVRIKLRDQPFRILVYLLERPSELVTRDELVRLLWPDGTLVDFDKGLNTAVNSLRETLRFRRATSVHRDGAEVWIQVHRHR